MIFSFKNQNTCHLFTEMAFLIRNSNSSERIYKKITSKRFYFQYFKIKLIFIITFQKKSYLNGLIHYWPIYQSNPKELVRYHEFTRFYRIKYTKNRFDQANSAFNFDNGAIFLPDGTYFQGGFTISLWFKLNSNKLNQQLIEIGNGMASDNFQLALSFNRRFSFCAYLHAVYGGQNLLLGTDPIEVNKWYHIGVTSDGKRANIYLNGQLKTSDRSIPMRNVQRTYNFLGFNYLKEVFFEGDLDDLKIFDRALSEEEMKEMYYMPF